MTIPWNDLKDEFFATDYTIKEFLLSKGVGKNDKRTVGWSKQRDEYREKNRVAALDNSKALQKVYESAALAEEALLNLMLAKANEKGTTMTDLHTAWKVVRTYQGLPTVIAPGGAGQGNKGDRPQKYDVFDTEIIDADAVEEGEVFS